MKAILLVRVSTKAQDFDEQEREIYNMAIKDGYLPECIIPICEKESGIKLAEEERAGLNKMKELIEEDNDINCVYCWEVSRIARRKKINFSVLDYLTTHKIQLVVKNPSIRLFKDNGDIDEGAEMVFTLFSQMAESEMRTKLARWKRTKDAKRKESIYTGGWILYGYTVDETTKKLIIDEKQANIVKTIFALYLTGKYSYGSLAKELMQTGLLVGYTLLTARKFISLTLNNLAYAGLPSSTNKRNNVKTEGNIYPQLVTLEMINKCKEIAKSNTNKPKKQYNNYYFGKGLLRCPYCGGIMVAKKNNNTYHCQECTKGFWIQINLVDSILWHSSIMLYATKLAHKDDEDRKQYYCQLTICDSKIKTSESRIKAMQERAEVIEHKAYVEGTLSITKADSFINELNNKIDKERKELNKWMNDRATIQNLLIEVSRDDKVVNLDKVAEIKDDKTRYDIIHEVFDCAFIDKIEQYKYTISIYPKLWNHPLQYTLNTKKNTVFTDVTEDIHQHLIGKRHSFIDDIEVLPISEEIKCYEERFKAVRNKEKNRYYNVKYCREHKEDNARRQREYRARQKALKVKDNQGE